MVQQADERFRNFATRNTVTGIEEIHGEFDVKWLGEEQRRVRTPKAPSLRPAAEGKELIGGRVKMSTRQGYVTGTVTNFDEAGYKMKMSNGEDLVWTLQEVQESWCASKHLMREGWTVEDQQALQSRVIKIVAEKEKVTKHRRVCLLYTSPSPRDLSTSRMPSSA